MTRPAIDPANIRRQQTAYKVRRWWLERLTALTIVVVLVGIANIENLIP